MRGMTASIRDRPAAAPGMGARSRLTIRRGCRCSRPSKWRMPTLDAVVAKVQRAAYAAQFRGAFGEHIFDDRALAFKGVLDGARDLSAKPRRSSIPTAASTMRICGMRPPLSAQEMRGLAAFNDPAKGNCARCHPSAMRNGAFPQFTDFGYAAIGAPRNRAIPANADRALLRSRVCADRCAPILRDKPNIAACSARRRCAMWRAARVLSQRRVSLARARWCVSTPSAIPSRRNGIRARPRAAR